MSVQNEHQSGPSRDPDARSEAGRKSGRTSGHTSGRTPAQATGRDAGEDPLSIGAPRSTDGAPVHDLIAACPPLDGNSLYANLLQCTHFAETCAIARLDGEAVAWVSGYIPPQEPDVYFLWQVAVGEAARGRKLPKRLVADLLARPACRQVRYIKTTITPDNEASWGLFRSLARWLKADLRDEVFFDRDRHFMGRHDSEILVTIGPFEPPGAPI